MPPHDGPRYIVGAATLFKSIMRPHPSVGQALQMYDKMNRLTVGNHDFVVGKVSFAFHADPVLTLGQANAARRNETQESDELLVDGHLCVGRRRRIGLQLEGHRGSQTAQRSE